MTVPVCTLTNSAQRMFPLPQILSLKKDESGAGEVTPVAKSAGSHRTGVQFPAPTQPLKTACGCSPRGSDVFFWPLQALYTCTHVYIDRPLGRIPILVR